MTREEKKRLRMQIIQLLERCDRCEHKTKLGASITVCKKCPIGQKLVEISSKFENVPKRIEGEQDVRIPWEEEEEQFLIKNYGKMKYEEMAMKLKRTTISVQSKVKKMRRKGLIPCFKKGGDMKCT
ncbi:MAG: hypothetical protein K6T39_00095 [Anoxybacillus ayderensis]|nr:hypothetical protein [Anoxybacillus ayderensis]